MGKRQQIEDLQLENDASNQLIRQLGDILGISVDSDITPQNVVGYMAKFSAALSSNHPIAPTAGQPGLSGGNFNTFDEDIDDEIDRANRTSGAGNAMVVRDVVVRDVVAQSHGDTTKEVITSIGQEVGMADAHMLTPSAALREILGRIRLLKGTGDVGESDNPQVSKGDSLQQAIQHNSSMRQHLDSEVARVRAIVARIAGAMQISKWDDDGTELIEKIQRWETFKHVLSRRIKELLVRPSADQGAVPGFVVAQELELILAKLMAPREFAKWLENKPRGTVSQAIMEIATATPPPSNFAMTDLIDLVMLLQRTDGTVSKPVRALLQDLRDSSTAADEFVRLMNLVIFPIVARQRAAQGKS